MCIRDRGSANGFWKTVCICKPLTESATPISAATITRMNRIERRMSVSYTHLDVYKRQDFGNVYGMFFALTGDGLSDRELSDYSELIKREVSELDGVEPVSYTHLDVYKRQVLHRTS